MRHSATQARPALSLLVEPRPGPPPHKYVLLHYSDAGISAARVFNTQWDSQNLDNEHGMDKEDESIVIVCSKSLWLVAKRVAKRANTDEQHEP